MSPQPYDPIDPDAVIGIVYIDRSPPAGSGILTDKARVFVFARCRPVDLHKTRRLARGMFEMKLDMMQRDEEDFVCIEHRSDWLDWTRAQRKN